MKQILHLSHKRRWGAGGVGGWVFSTQSVYVLAAHVYMFYKWRTGGFMTGVGLLKWVCGCIQRRHRQRYQVFIMRQCFALLISMFWCWKHIGPGPGSSEHKAPIVRNNKQDNWSCVDQFQYAPTILVTFNSSISKWRFQWINCCVTFHPSNTKICQRYKADTFWQTSCLRSSIRRNVSGSLAIKDTLHWL